MSAAPAEGVPFPFLPGVLTGQTADVYFLRTREVLRALGENPWVGMEIFAGRGGTVCGIGQVAQLLGSASIEGELWALDEGMEMASSEPVLQLFGRYDSFGI